VLTLNILKFLAISSAPPDPSTSDLVSFLATLLCVIEIHFFICLPCTYLWLSMGNLSQSCGALFAV